MATKKTPIKNNNSSEKKTSSQIKKVDINYLKTNNYRTYHVDGIFGGLTPDAKKIYIELFVQRSATPKRVQYEVVDGRIGEETGDREGLEGLVREVESGLIMDVEVARVLRDWLSRKIESVDKEEK